MSKNGCGVSFVGRGTVLLMGLWSVGMLAVVQAGCVQVSRNPAGKTSMPSKRESGLTKTPRPGRPIGRVAVVYSTHYRVQLAGAEKLHPFDINKYQRIYGRLLDEGLVAPADVYVPAEATEQQIRLVHSESFLAGLNDSATVARCLEVPALKAVPASLVDAGVLSAFRHATGGTILAAELATEGSCDVAINLAGGYHHAKRDRGEGFNVYNDLAIAIRWLRRSGQIERAMVIDLDVHQGNGTAEVFAGVEQVFTFSMHQGNIYPIPKARSDRDVELLAGTGDPGYLAKLTENVPAILDAHKPDLVLVQAGCDTLAEDPLAGLAMTPDGVVRRDAYVVEQCHLRGIPVVLTLGGGYADQAWRVQYESVANLLRTYGGPHRRLHRPIKSAGTRLGGL